jgi:predicted solute-binding protein
MGENGLKALQLLYRLGEERGVIPTIPSIDLF